MGYCKNTVNKGLVLLFFTVSLLLSTPVLPSDSVQNKQTLNILWIFSWHKDLPWQKDVEQGINKHFATQHLETDFYYEYLDGSRLKALDTPKLIQSFLAKKNKKSLNSNDINRSKILLLDEGHCLRDHALATCDTKTKANVDAFKATSLLTLVQMVANGTGITLLPELVINSRLIRNSNIKIMDYENKKNFREISICWRKSSPRIVEFQLLADFFKKYL